MEGRHSHSRSYSYSGGHSHSGSHSGSRSGSYSGGYSGNYSGSYSGSHSGRHSHSRRHHHHSPWRPKRAQWIWFGAAVVALGVVLFFVRHREWADFYAQQVYPRWSGAVSWLTGWIPFSLDEVLVVAAVVGVIACLVRFRRRWMALLALLMWLVVWFYAGWGINYFRSDIFARAGVMQPSARDDARFEAFLQAYTERLNDSFVPVETIDKKALALEIKNYFSDVPECFELAGPKPWQRPKRLAFSRLYSGVGVLGFVGPFFNEIQVNAAVPPVQYPFTYAHELSHLLGVSSEAEANYWAFKACTASAVPAFRYAGWQSLLPHVWSNARLILPEEEFRAWTESLRPEVIAAFQAEQDYWAERYSPFIGRIQGRLYDRFLKGNNIPSGTANYSEVIQMILALD